MPYLVLDRAGRVLLASDDPGEIMAATAGRAGPVGVHWLTPMPGEQVAARMAANPAVSMTALKAAKLSGLAGRGLENYQAILDIPLQDAWAAIAPAYEEARDGDSTPRLPVPASPQPHLPAPSARLARETSRKLSNENVRSRPNRTRRSAVLPLLRPPPTCWS